MGARVRSTVVAVCMEPGLKEQLEALADESKRSVSDYCRYVLEQHFLMVKREQGLLETQEDQAEFEHRG